MLGSCSFIEDNGNFCNRTYLLHNLFFRDPYAVGSPELTDICKRHYEILTGESLERIRGFQMKLANMISEAARLRKIALANGVYLDNNATQQKIEDLKALIKKIQNSECKNFFCNNDLTKLERFTKLYSVHAFKPSGRRHYTFYYCSLKCYNIMRAKCGLKVPFIQGQTVLNP